MRSKHERSPKLRTWTVSGARAAAAKMNAAADQAKREGQNWIDLEQVLDPEELKKLTWQLPRFLLFQALTRQFTVMTNAVRKGQLHPDVAQQLMDIGTDVRDRLKEALENKVGARIASQGARRKGVETRKSVEKIAVQLKKKNRRLSKLQVARRIATAPHAPCGFEAAKKHLGGSFNRVEWNKLGSSGR